MSRSSDNTGQPKRREIRADYDASTIVVYQAYREGGAPAYREEIALAALAAGRFVAPFSLNRMTWIKPDDPQVRLCARPSADRY